MSLTFIEKDLVHIVAVKEICFVIFRTVSKPKSCIVREIFALYD